MCCIETIMLHGLAALQCQKRSLRFLCGRERTADSRPPESMTFRCGGGQMKFQKQVVSKGLSLSAIFCAALLVFSLMGRDLFGQLPTATIAGTVKDASGAVIPGV